MSVLIAEKYYCAICGRFLTSSEQCLHPEITYVSSTDITQYFGQLGNSYITIKKEKTNETD